MNANHFIIKHASQEDIPALTAVERECFPAAEAASEATEDDALVETVSKISRKYSARGYLLRSVRKIIALK